MKQVLRSALRVSTLIILILVMHNLNAQVSGKIFHDANANGTQQAINPTEPSLSGVSVTAYLIDGTSITVMSDVNGDYSFSAAQIPAGTPVRIEFTGLPNQANQLQVGGNLVQFLTAGAGATNKNLGVAFPADYCESNPFMVTPCYVETGDPNLDVVVRFSYKNVGTAPLDETPIAQSQMTGALWGIAYSRSQKLIYAAAVLKTHIPLGPQGLDAIYTIDPYSGTPNATPFIELTEDLGIAVSSVSAEPQYLDNATRSVLVSPQNDAQAFIDVGKVGLGDIELSGDEKTLYVVNLYDKKLYAIDIATKTVVDSYVIPNPGCSNGIARPWALGEYEGQIYIGVTCDGSASGVPSDLLDNSGVANLKVTVYRLDGATFTQVMSSPIDYEREPPFNYEDGIKSINRWKPWADVLPQTGADGNIGYPQPLMTDIEFDDNGHMILGFTDRAGFQIGYNNYGPTGTTLYSLYSAGEILRACKSGANWSLESVGSGCSSTDGLAAFTHDANGYLMSWGAYLEKGGEFYWGDFFHGDGNFDGSGLSFYPGHPEITIGGLAVLPGSGEVMSVSYDPVTGSANYNTGGVITLSNTTGMRVNSGYQLYLTQKTPESPTQGKGVGLGDLEALCAARPVEITVRVWNDTNEDGIQDPSEAPIEGVTYEIFADTNNDGTPDGPALGSATTNADGLIYLTPANVADGDPIGMGNQAGPQVGLKYLLRVAPSDWTGGAGVAELTDLAPTLKDVDPTANGDARDSDASIVAAAPQISVNTTLTGSTQFVLGSGFRVPPPCPASNCATATLIKN